ncbi:PREDICTED: dimethyladenosine transferase 2, mitochondrial-like isoform X2 [Priapulus caudatus]|uniref:rRNA adenine N(6)-methyltransferase n=1 Tax=Priapulus caudatus TaxID=37621 RepID=A0ABM1EHX3_PRICU|nr:PREDICTED: dimethyladenosine transferase 2, mitochondrial-like isoform X2 [Priapulus caudatus]
MAHLYFMPFASRRILILMESKSHVFNSRVAVGIRPLHSITPTWFTHEEGCEVSDYTLQKRHKKLLFRRNRHAESMYVINERVADMLLDKLGNDLKQDSGRSIFEINPGPGVLTKKLLQSGFERIRVFEPHNEFIPYLKILESQYPHNLVLVPKDLTTIHTLSTRCKTSESTMLEGISRRPWHEDSPVTIVGVLPWKQYTFLRHMLWRLSNMSGLFSLGRCQFCLYIPHKEYWYMTAEPGILLSRYRATTVYYRLFFDIKLLHREPRSSFHPPGSEQIVKSSGAVGTKMWSKTYKARLHNLHTDRRFNTEKLHGGVQAVIFMVGISRQQLQCSHPNSEGTDG